MLLVIWSVPVLPAPIPDNCAPDFQQARRLVNLLHLKATDLKDEYLKKHRINNVDIPDEAPTSTVTGSSLLEKLEDIYTKNRLFRLHILQVKKYQYPHPNPLSDGLKEIARTLSHHLHVLENTLGCLDLRTHPTTSPSLPDMDHHGDYSKKVYGWGVIVRLIEWLDEVKIVLAPRKFKNNKGK
uniref:Ciliary neurotrophic factor n=1 Tax=Nothobranchius rachovii TaxID=451742 RepID=A0A1A8NPE6_9TELE